MVQNETQKEETSLFQMLAWIYAAKFVFIASLSYITGIVDADGFTFGLFTLDMGRLSI